MLEYVKQSALALVLTEIIELGAAWLLGWRHKRELGAILLINIITNPLLNYLILVNSYFNLISPGRYLVWGLEAGVVLVEWRLLVYIFRQRERKMLALSVIMNGSSFLAGLLFFKYFDSLL